MNETITVKDAFEQDVLRYMLVFYYGEELPHLGGEEVISITPVDSLYEIRLRRFNAPIQCAADVELQIISQFSIFELVRLYIHEWHCELEETNKKPYEFIGCYGVDDKPAMREAQAQGLIRVWEHTSMRGESDPAAAWIPQEGWWCE